MKYNQPLGGAANDPYIDGNDLTGVEGSDVPAAAIEDPQREIMNLIGLLPDIVASDADLTQVAQVVKRLALATVTTLAANAALTAAQTGLILVDASGGPVTITLPAANANAYQGFCFHRLDTSANLVTIQRAGADTIDQSTLFHLWVRGHARTIKTDGVSAWRTIAKRTDLVHGRCSFQYVDATHVKLVPLDGDGLQINGDVHSLGAGLTSSNAGVYVSGVAAQNLAATTVYLAFVFDNNGAVTFDFWPLATGHLADTNAGNLGVEVRSNGGAADSTRTLVGMVRTDGSAHFLAQSAGGLIGWFNRRAVGILANASSLGFSSTALAEISTALRASFLTWADESVFAVCDGTRTNSISSTGGSDNLQTAIDGGAVGTLSGGYVSGSSGQSGSFSSSYAGYLAEGFHYATLLGDVSPGSTGTISQGYTRVRVRG